MYAIAPDLDKAVLVAMVVGFSVNKKVPKQKFSPARTNQVRGTLLVR